VLLEFHLPTPRCNPQLELHLRTSKTPRKPSLGARRTHLPQPGKCRAPCHLTPLVNNVEHLLRLFPGELSAPPSTSPFYDWMANNKTESFVGALCVSWVFYRDAQQRDDRCDTVYNPQFFARVSAPNQDSFIMMVQICPSSSNCKPIRSSPVSTVWGKGLSFYLRAG
jgi:hypothetical protein